MKINFKLYGDLIRGPITPIIKVDIFCYFDAISKPKNVQNLFLSQM